MGDRPIRGLVRVHLGGAARCRRRSARAKRQTLYAAAATTGERFVPAIFLRRVSFWRFVDRRCLLITASTAFICQFLEASGGVECVDFPSLPGHCDSLLMEEFSM